MISSLLILDLVRSLFFCNMPALLVGFRQFCAKSMLFLLTQINFVCQAESLQGAHQGEEAAASAPEEFCRSCNRQLVPPAGRHQDDGPVEARRDGAPSAADIALVMERLGFQLAEEDGGARLDGRCRGCFLAEAAEGVLEEKAASAEELAGAFAVFDSDGDGYVGAEELQAVMRRLGWAEGAELEDCRRMIGAYDEDGDGRIDLAEFRRLLERAT